MVCGIASTSMISVMGSSWACHTQLSAQVSAAEMHQRLAASYHHVHDATDYHANIVAFDAFFQGAIHRPQRIGQDRSAGGQRRPGAGIETLRSFGRSLPGKQISNSAGIARQKVDGKVASRKDRP